MLYMTNGHITRQRTISIGQLTIKIEHRWFSITSSTRVTARSKRKWDLPESTTPGADGSFEE
jgi:hypothetical protein